VSSPKHHDGAALPLEGKRILIIVENEPVPFDRRVWQEACALRAAGASVRIISPASKGYEAKYEQHEGIHIYRHPWFEATSVRGYFIEYPLSLFWQFALATHIFLRYGFDVIHGCNPPDLTFLLALAFRPLGAKFVFDHHDISPELYEASFGHRGLLWRTLVLAERLTFRTADVTIATNESYRQIAIERGKKHPEDVFVVRNGPDLTRVRPVPPNNRWKQGHLYLVVYVGVIGRQEGIDLLLHSINHIASGLQRRDIHFCIVGGGASLAHYMREAMRLHVTEAVTFTGRTSDEVLFEILSTADVCVCPDRVTEFSNKSTMMKILEYMAFGKPVVQFNGGEGRFTAQSASLYAKPNDPINLADQILKLIDSPSLRSEMGRFALARIETQLSWEHQVPSLIAAYKRLLFQTK
jgi:glycosyltransferase involved in cell wall biosynthesis